MNNWIRYTLDHFYRIYNVPGSVKIHYGDSSGEQGVHIPSVAQSFFQQSDLLTPSHLEWVDWNGRSIPILFPEETDRPLINQTEGGTQIHADILGSAFYMLSGWQEYHSNQRDQHGRFPFHASIQNKAGFIQIPVVDYYFDILKTAIEQAYKTNLGLKSRAQRDFTIALTHDIDNLHSGWLEDGFHCLKRGKLLSGMKIGWNKLVRGEDTWFNLRHIACLENGWDVGSSFYMLPRNGHIKGVAHSDYDLQHSEVRTLLGFLHQNDYEIGVHGSIGAHRSIQQFRQDLECIDQPVVGGRFHYLSYDPATTPSVLEQSGLIYDTTLGFAEHCGFRNGTCRPFPIYNLAEDRATSVLEIPLIVMDTTLQNAKYMNLSTDQALQAVVPVLDEVHKFGGASAILWHNSYFSPYKYHGWKDLLHQLITHLKKQGGTIVSARKLLSSFHYS